MTDLTLWFAPDTCARVTMIALEETGQPYRAELVAFLRGDHRSPDYLARNPAGKVPTLVIDGEPLTENVAILLWLADRFPEARLLPPMTDPLARGRVSADLAHCAANLHPIVTRLRIPQYFCDLPDAIPRVFAMAEAAMRPHFAHIDRRLAEQPWWFGEQWSVLDAYINWVWFRVTGTAFDAADFPNLARHDASMQARPAVQRTLARHAEAQTWLAERGLTVRFSGSGAVAARPA